MNHDELLTRSLRRTFPMVILGLMAAASAPAVLGAEGNVQTQSTAIATPPVSVTTAAITTTNERPRMTLPEPANLKLPSLFLIGDSTVRNGRGDGINGQWGWGEPIAAFFDKTKINVVNRAVGGLSSRTFLTQGHWERTLSLLKPGDFVMMQFGHNDGGAVNDASRARASLKGIGEENQEIDNMLTRKHEVVHSFGWYLRKFIADTKAKGATPIVCSLIPRKIWKDGKIARNKEDYAGWAAEVAREEGVAFVDLNEIIARRYDELGQEKVEALFADEHTHTSMAGAQMNAACVIAGLKGLKTNPLSAYLLDQTVTDKLMDIKPFSTGPK